MKNELIVMCVMLALAACTTPSTTLKNAKTGAVATCGGHDQASYAAGAIGYHVQKDKDEACVAKYKQQGYKVTETRE